MVMDENTKTLERIARKIDYISSQISDESINELNKLIDELNILDDNLIDEIQIKYSRYLIGICNRLIISMNR